MPPDVIEPRYGARAESTFTDSEGFLWTYGRQEVYPLLYDLHPAWIYSAPCGLKIAWTQIRNQNEYSYKTLLLHNPAFVGVHRDGGNAATIAYDVMAIIENRYASPLLWRVADVSLTETELGIALESLKTWARHKIDEREAAIVKYRSQWGQAAPGEEVSAYAASFR
jgi:hypothetical protein